VHGYYSENTVMQSAFIFMALQVYCGAIYLILTVWYVLGAGVHGY
jgi:hypothetical protein